MNDIAKNGNTEDNTIIYALLYDYIYILYHKLFDSVIK